MRWTLHFSFGASETCKKLFYSFLLWVQTSPTIYLDASVIFRASCLHYARGYCDLVFHLYASFCLACSFMLGSTLFISNFIVLLDHVFMYSISLSFLLILASKVSSCFIIFIQNGQVAPECLTPVIISMFLLLAHETF